MPVRINSYSDVYSDIYASIEVLGGSQEAIQVQCVNESKMYESYTQAIYEFLFSNRTLVDCTYLGIKVRYVCFNLKCVK